MCVEGAVTDSGAQLMIIPVKTPKVELLEANGAKMNVVGVVNAHIKATSPSGEQFRTTSKFYKVSYVDE